MNNITDYLMLGFNVATSPYNLLVATIGAFFGTVVGLLPGLGPINGVAILIPIAFALNLPPESALILLAAVYVGTEYGGRISSILINVPGDAGAVMTTLDGYPLTKKGLSSVALSLSAWASFVGSVLAFFGIVIFAPLLASWALAFGPAEYFALMIFAFCCLTGLLGNDPIKGLLAALLGLSISTIGIDANSGLYRFTFDIPNLADGLSFIVVVIAFFAISEMLQLLENRLSGGKTQHPQGKRKLFNFQEMKFTLPATLRSSLTGFGLGVLPGAGASVASAVAYANEKTIAENNDPNACFGEGDLRGLAAPEAANNAAATGSFIPMLTLGVPGSGTTAVMMGALTLYNITPGPVLFEQQPALVWGFIASLLVANIILLVLNIPLVRLFAKILALPIWLLTPLVISISFIGVYAINGTTFDLVVISVLGLIGYFLRKMQLPMAPLILGVVLGNLMEQNLRRALSMTNGEISILFESYISKGFWLAAVLVVLVPPLLRFYIRGKKKKKAADNP